MSALNDRLTKTLDNLKTKFMSIRTGRANPDLLSSIKVDYYGRAYPFNSWHLFLYQMEIHWL